MEHAEHRIVGRILVPCLQRPCCSCKEQAATVMVGLFGDLCQVVEQCDGCVPKPVTDEIAEIFAAALTQPSTREG